jgi:hypothetical protein
MRDVRRARFAGALLPPSIRRDIFEPAFGDLVVADPARTLAGE